MTKEQSKLEIIDLQAVLERDAYFIRAAMRSVVQAALEAEMTDALGAEKSERPRTDLAIAAAITRDR